MPHDPIQIALEHHRAGRLRRAEDGYRAVLADRPADADALHWLGVLLAQSGQLAEALQRLSDAVRSRPDDPDLLQNYGRLALATGDADGAVVALERAVARASGRAETAAALAQAYLVRRDVGDADRAVAVLRGVASAGGDVPAMRHNLGVALLAAGRATLAAEQLESAVAAQPVYPPAHYFLGEASAARGDTIKARRHLNRALEQDPKMARAWRALGAVDADAGNLDVAVAHYRKAIRLRPDDAAAYRGLGYVLARQGKRAEGLAMIDRAARLAAAPPPAPAPVSVEELERRITPDAFGERLHQAFFASLNLPAPRRIAAEEVTDLFDRYAGRFDTHLTETLQYRVPEQIAAAVERLRSPGQRFDVLDLGCGTGLCGPLLKPMARSLAGVDLSGAMVAKALERGVYDRVEQGDLVEAMWRLAEPVDLLVATDVLIYIGDLTPTFEAARSALRPGGWFAFSVESGPEERYQLSTRTRRYSHGDGYLRRLAGIFGFDVRLFDAITVRVDANQPVPGRLVVMAR